MLNRISRMYKRGILGMNARNIAYINEFNRRRYYPIADNKLLFKKLAIEHNVPVPVLLGTVETYGNIKNIERTLSPFNDFVIKPAHGAGGDGVMVIRREGDALVRANGQQVGIDDIKYHLNNMLAGLFSLGGVRDYALIEQRVVFDDCFKNIAWQGVPDIRLIVFTGVPAMAMIRLPTTVSNGRANLHQGAIGAGIRIADGVTRTGVQGSSLIDRHPDTGNGISGIEIPFWSEILSLGVRCHQLSKLGYLGVDVVIDRERGPLVLEINARPGLAVQIANGDGLRRRLNMIEKARHTLKTEQELVAFARKHF